ncbi:MAG: DUF4386 domain-containing protein [Anaerolineae bacterium]|nr:DUF4386 domain-containing protein [Anaerolineae bacterium]
MNTTRAFAETTLRRTARTAGLLYAVIIVGSVFGGVLTEMSLSAYRVAPGDIASAADGMLASPWLFRIGFVGYFTVFLSDLAVAVLLYALLRSVNHNLALLAAAFRLGEAIIIALNSIHQYTAFQLMSGTDYAGVFNAEQVNALATMSLDAHRAGYLVGQALFAVHCLLLGYLLYKSGYFPRLLGALLMIAAVAYMAESTAYFVLPGDAGVQGVISLAVGVSAFAAELWLTYWLLFRGAAIQQRYERMSLNPNGAAAAAA